QQQHELLSGRVGAVASVVIIPLADRTVRSDVDRAVTQGLRTKARAIDVPSLLRDVLEAAAASGRDGSWNISAVHRASKPASSARRARRANSAAGAIPAAIERRLM